MNNDCKCGDGCTCHTKGEGGGVETSKGEGGPAPFVKECKCGKKCKKDSNSVD